MNGLLVIDKPLALSSRGAVDIVAGWFPEARVGHTGTLDPAATGVLVMCLGVATRLTEQVQAMEKVYRTDVCLGARSTTDDTEGVITPEPSAAPMPRTAVETALASFLGVIDQVPPPYSAAKVNGRRAYHLARRGKDVVLEPRKVRIDAIDIVAYDYPQLTIEVRCGKGTYIRSLARDLGERLGTGAYLTGLRRTRVGPFRVEDALTLMSGAEVARARLRPLAEAASQLPRVVLVGDEATRFMWGQTLTVALPAGETAIYSESGAFLAVGEVRGNALKPIKVFHP